jgi:hypothetical protein
MPVMPASQTLSISIACTPDKIYQSVSNPANLPQWATSFCKSARQSGIDWIVETSQGDVSVRFAEQNGWGILDHDVTLGSGDVIHVPMRVVANGSGSEVLFTLFQLPGMSDDQYAIDTAMVKSDLKRLKQILDR